MMHSAIRVVDADERMADGTYSVIPTELLNDRELTPLARLLGIWLRSQSPDWTTNERAMAQAMSVKDPKTVRTALNSLCDHGWLRIEVNTNPETGRAFQRVYLVRKAGRFKLSKPEQKPQVSDTGDFSGGKFPGEKSPVVLSKERAHQFGAGAPVGGDPRFAGGEGGGLEVVTSTEAIHCAQPDGAPLNDGLPHRDGDGATGRQTEECSDLNSSVTNTSNTPNCIACGEVMADCDAIRFGAGPYRYCHLGCDCPEPWDRFTTEVHIQGESH